MKHQDPAWLREKYIEEEMTMEEMAALTDVTLQTIHHHIHKHDIPVRGYEKVDIDEEWLREQYYHEWRTVEEIAEEFDTTRKTVLKRMDEYGMPRRNPGWSK